MSFLCRSSTQRRHLSFALGFSQIVADDFREDVSRRNVYCQAYLESGGGGITVTRVSDVLKGGALSDTLGKLTSAHRARGPTSHEGWALAAVGRGGKGGGSTPTAREGKIPRGGG